MRLEDFLSSVAGLSGMRYEGRRSGDFHGFSPPGTRSEPERFFTVLDDSWPHLQRIKIAQNDWSRDQIAALVESRGLTRLLVPHSMGEEPFGPGRDYLYVDGTYRFLVEAGLRGRERASQQGRAVVGVTGSSGKSTFKAMLEHAYRAAHPESGILAPPPHFNTYVRVLSELTRSADHELSILELSAGGQGVFFNESLREGTSISPDVAVITSISHAHTYVMKNLSGVVNQKGAILDAPKPGAWAVLNADTLRAQKLRQRADSRGWQVAEFGESPEAAFRLESYDPAQRWVRAATPLGTFEYQLGAAGRHMAYNSLAVLATLAGIRATGHGLGPGELAELGTVDSGAEDLEAAAASFSSFTALPGRGEISEVPLSGGGQITIIDESYNANPASMRAAVDGLADRSSPAGEGRKVAVLADMRMLGRQEVKLHRQLLQTLSEAAIDRFYLHGELMGEALEGSPLEADPRVTHVDQQEALISLLGAELTAGDTVVFKGSHSMGLDQVIEALAAGWVRG